MYYYQIKELYWRIKTFFFPRQKWLFNKIPNSWIDKDHLWEICILEGLVHYVEQDGGLGFKKGDYEFSQNDSDYPEYQKQFDREVKFHYDLIKKKLPELEAQLELEWKKVPPTNIDDIVNQTSEWHKQEYEKKYGEIDRIENMISDLKTKIMLWCVLKRESIWT